MKEKLKTLQTMGRALHLQSEKLKHQLQTLHQTLHHKNESIARLEAYRQSYEKGAGDESLMAIFMHNNQHFVAQLSRAIFREREEISRLRAIESDVRANYFILMQKRDGLSTLVDEQKVAIAIEESKAEERQILDVITGTKRSQ